MLYNPYYETNHEPDFEAAIEQDVEAAIEATIAEYEPRDADWEREPHYYAEELCIEERSRPREVA